MKKLLLLIIAIASFTGITQAQTLHTSTIDEEKVTILNGIISKNDLEKNDAFKSWYPTNQASYNPDAAFVNALRANKGKVQYVVFGGTWCGDTQNILPKFFKLQAQSGVSENDLSIFAVDRSKKTIGNIQEAFKITNVPTIIVMKDGKELGRIVEYGKTGQWDKELAELLK